MHRRLGSFSSSSSPPPPLPDQTLILTKPPRDSHSGTSLSPSFLIIAVILTAVFLVSLFIHLLLRYLSRRCNTSPEEDDDVELPIPVPVRVSSANPISSRRVAPEDSSSTPNPNPNHKSLIESLPLFSFNSISAVRSSADCAVCLSKFEPHDQMRLLPICCHAFHAECIDTWLESNHTCPLCRSSVHVEDLDNYLKILSSGSSRESFRVEIGNVSSRRAPAAAAGSGSDRSRSRSYSIGSFEYLVDDSPPEVVLETTPAHRRRDSETVSKKDETPPTQAPRTPGDDVAAEVSEGRGWLKDYMDRLSSSSVSSSRAMSFRFSGRFFTGSSRRSDAFSGSGRRSNGSAGINGGSCDSEATQYTEEIGNFLRWLSGV